MDRITQCIIQNHQGLNEMFLQMRGAQAPRDQLHFMEVATEAVATPATRGKLVQKLYTDILKKSTFDFGKIGASKGTLTKYEHYDKLVATNECLLGIAAGKEPCRALKAFGRLHDILIEARADFEFGYKFNIEFIQLTYKSLVLALHQLLDIAICETTDYLRDVCHTELAGDNRAKGTPYGAIFLSNIESFIRSYDNGDWGKMMKGFKGSREAWLGESIIVAGAAVVTATVAILGIIRFIIYFFNNSKTKLRNYAETEAAILRKYMEVNKDEGPAIEKQKKMLEFLEGERDMINARTIGTERATQKDLEDSNRDMTKAMTNRVDPDTDDFELI